MLLASGYLKVESYSLEKGVGEYSLKLTNGEVKLMFRNMVEVGLNDIHLRIMILLKHCC